MCDAGLVVVATTKITSKAGSKNRKVIVKRNGDEKSGMLNNRLLVGTVDGSPF